MPKKSGVYTLADLNKNKSGKVGAKVSDETSSPMEALPDSDRPRRTKTKMATTRIVTKKRVKTSSRMTVLKKLMKS